MTGSLGPVSAGGMLIAIFDVAGNDGPAAIVREIERDRELSAVRAGFVRKLLPIYIDPDTGAAQTGGSYLFDTLENARAYEHWELHENLTDGKLFTDRPFVSNYHSYAAHVIGAEDFKPLNSGQGTKHVQIWRLAEAKATVVAQQLLPQVRQRCQAAGLSSFWLAASEDNVCIALLTVGEPGERGEGLDYAALHSLKGKSPLPDGDPLLSGATKLEDQCFWVFTVWQPFSAGIRMPAALWPNSPPLPAPERDSLAG
jgi:hypothetical protein